MPDRRRHRGKHPEDDALFAPSGVERMHRAVDDYCLLRTKGYAAKASLKIVGDHFQLTSRQRNAVARSSCADAERVSRRDRHMCAAGCAGVDLAVDGFNQLITLESALSGAILLRGRDGVLRDLAGIHGSYHRVEETSVAIDYLGDALSRLEPRSTTVYLDAPVSNSGRMCATLREASASNGWEWHVELQADPDRAIIASGKVAVTSDSWIIDNCERWLCAVDWIVPAQCPDAVIVEL